MNGPQHIRRFVALCDDEEVVIEIRTNDSGVVEYTVGERSGQAQFTVASGGGAVLLAREARQLALRVAFESDQVSVVGRDSSMNCALYPESRFLVSKMQGGLGPGAGTINASMPGRVVKILIKEGDSVEQGQGLLILEAMKMENEIKAPRSGVISSLKISEGESVESGVIMVEIADE
jgi:biotin carboxyl carrier protein